MNSIINLGVLVVLFCISSIYRVDCKTIVEMQFKEFENPNNRLANGRCCDTNFGGAIVGCPLSCEHFFEISVKPYPGNKPEENRTATYVLADGKGKTTIKKGMQLNRKIRNPWVFTYDKPYVSNLLVICWHFDLIFGIILDFVQVG